MYRFDLQPQLLPDYEVANWYVSTHPQSHFVTRLTAALPASYRRFALSNNQLSIHHAGGTDQRVLRTADELRAVLQDTFGLTLPDSPALADALERLTSEAPG